MIRIESIKRTFNPHRKNANKVLKGVSFDLPEKGLIAIFGKSGSGKTTLLNIIGGLDKQDSGKVYINDKDMSKKRDYIRNSQIGYIFQNYYLESGYTIAEIMRNAMLIAGFKDEKEIERRTEEVLTLVKMERYKNKKSDALSGGQKQRVAIARALIKGSDIILADEPTGNLDAENTIIIMDILKEISKTQLVVLVTHEVNLIHNYADSHIKIVDGELKDNEELEADIKYEVDHNNIYVDKESKKSYQLGRTAIDVYGDSDKDSNIEIYSDKGSVYIKPGKGVTVLDEDSEKHIIFKGLNEQEENAALLNGIDSIPNFEKSNSKRNGRLFNLRTIFSKKGACAERRAKGNIFKNIFLAVIALVMCFMALVSFEIYSIDVETKKLNPNSLYLNLNTYYDIKMIEQTSEEKMYERVDFFDTERQVGEFSFSEAPTLSSVSLSYEPKSLDTLDEDNIKLVAGKMPGLSEIVITTNLVDAIQKEFRHEEINNDNAMLLLDLNGKFKVVGIIEGDEPICYMNKQDYVNFLGVYNEILFTDQEDLFFKDEYKEVYYSSEIVVDPKEKEEPNEVRIEINRNSLYKMVPDVVEADFLVKAANAKLRAHKGATSLLIRNSELYVKELSITREVMDTDIRIYVSPQAMDNIFVYLKPNINALKENVSKQGIPSEFFYELVAKDKEQLKELKKLVVDELDIPLVNVKAIYNKQKLEVKENALGNLTVFYIIVALLLCIYYFIEKSGSLQNSKEYGIYRAIGVNRSNLLYKETMTTLVGNILTYFACYVVIVILMSIRYFMMNIEFSMFIAIAMGIFGISAILMILISLVPYLFVLVKTPAAILARYDI